MFKDINHLSNSHEHYNTKRIPSLGAQLFYWNSVKFNESSLKSKRFAGAASVAVQNHTRVVVDVWGYSVIAHVTMVCPSPVQLFLGSRIITCEISSKQRSLMQGLKGTVGGWPNRRWTQIDSTQPCITSKTRYWEAIYIWIYLLDNSHLTTCSPFWFPCILLALLRPWQTDIKRCFSLKKKSVLTRWK